MIRETTVINRDVHSLRIERPEPTATTEIVTSCAPGSQPDEYGTIACLLERSVASLINDIGWSHCSNDPQRCFRPGQRLCSQNIRRDLRQKNAITIVPCLQAAATALLKMRMPMRYVSEPLRTPCNIANITARRVVCCIDGGA